MTNPGSEPNFWRTSQATTLAMLLVLTLSCLLKPPAASAADATLSCAVTANGEFLRADGHARQPWSIKVSGQPIVYVEKCLMEHLLAFFPEEIRKRRFALGTGSLGMGRPGIWTSTSGQTILTLSPESRFQLAASIMFIESQFHPNVSPSSAGAVGAFQVLPTTGQQVGLPRVHEPGTNLQAGLKYILYIEEQIARHCDFEETAKEGSTLYRNLIAAAYNAGPNYLTLRDDRGRTCRLEAFPEFTRTEYIARFQRAMGYQYLPAYLRYDPTASR